MGGKRWTQEELRYLDEYADRKSAADIGKKLGRSYSAVKRQMGRRKVKGYRDSTDMLSTRKVREILGIGGSAINILVRNGLEFKPMYRMYVVEQNTLVRFLKEHPDLWNARRVKDDTIFGNQEWYWRKREIDKKPKRFWTNLEAVAVRRMYCNGMKVADIANKVGRTEQSVSHKIGRMRRNNSLW